MRNINYVNVDFIMEKIKEEEFSNLTAKEMNIKEWIYEALRFINSMQLFEQKEIVLNPIKEEKRLKIPTEVNYLVHVLNSDGIQLEEVHHSFDTQMSSRDSYMVRSRYIYFNNDIDEVKLVTLSLPLDDDGRPLILDNNYVINAVVSYVQYKMAKKLWMTKRMPYQMYEHFETEWIYSCATATNSLNTPSFDELLSLDTLYFGFPVSKLQIIT